MGDVEAKPQSKQMSIGVILICVWFGAVVLANLYGVYAYRSFMNGLQPDFNSADAELVSTLWSNIFSAVFFAALTTFSIAALIGYRGAGAIWLALALTFIMYPGRTFLAYFLAPEYSSLPVDMRPSLTDVPWEAITAIPSYIYLLFSKHVSQEYDFITPLNNTERRQKFLRKTRKLD